MQSTSGGINLLLADVTKGLFSRIYISFLSSSFKLPPKKDLFLCDVFNCRIVVEKGITKFCSAINVLFNM